MKKLVHKNQIIITALAVMIVVAGYLNFTGQEIATGNILQKDAKQTQSTVKVDGKKTDKKESKTTKVSKKGAKTTAKKADSKKDAVTKDISEEDSAKVTVNDNGEVVASQENPGEAVMVSNTIGTDYFSSAKLSREGKRAYSSREQTRAKNKETLLEIVNNKALASADKKAAVKEVAAITKLSEKENATEMMLEAKGFADAMVSLSDKSADVVVNAEELSSKQMAQIIDIVKRKTGFAAENIVITPVQIEKN